MLRVADAIGVVGVDLTVLIKKARASTATKKSFR
jgi:hypothetical protein